MTRIFLSKSFNKLAKACELTDEQLIVAIDEMDDGIVVVNLGGSLFKKRIAIKGRGKSSGVRTILGFKQGDRAFFVYVFAKSNQSNISKSEKAAFIEQSKIYFSLDDKTLIIACNSGALREIVDSKESENE